MKCTKIFLIGLIMSFNYLISAEHLLITEICVRPTESEFIEIYNPSDEEIDLSNYYLTDATYASGGNFYYNLPLQNGTAGAAGSGNYYDFNVKFPDGEKIGPKEFKVIAFKASNFLSTYGFNPDFEIITDETNGIPDMIPAEEGSIDEGDSPAGLSNDGEVVILYYWDGISDLVKDIDYIVWGDKNEAVCKTGVSIDGPDEDNIPSTYNEDTSISDQIPLSTSYPHANGKTIGRVSYIEYGEIQSGGNGITGHDETSENLSESFKEQDPNPGSGPAVGAPSIISIEIIPTLPSPSEEIIVKAKFEDDGTIVSANVFYHEENSPEDSTEMFYGEDGYWYGTIPSFGTGNIKVNYYAKITDNDELTCESSTDYFYIRSDEPTDIAYIQNNINDIQGQIFTVSGVVTIGSGKISTNTTQIYIQDNSGRGINLFNYVYMEKINRGDSIIVTGVTDQYFSTTEIKDFAFTILDSGKSLPNPLEISIGNLSDDLEGTYISTSGKICKKEETTGGTNYYLTDGNDTLIVRIPAASGIDTSYIKIDYIYYVTGVLTIYRDEYELIVTYDDNIIYDAVEEEKLATPSQFGITHIYPNPFNPTSTIWFNIDKKTKVSLSIYSLDGKLIKNIISDYKEPGKYSATWNGRDDQGKLLSSGIYFVVLKAGNLVDTRKITYLK